MKMLTPTQVAEVLSIRQPKVREWLNKGLLKGWKVGRIWRISEENLEEFIEDHMNHKGRNSKDRTDAEETVLQVTGSFSCEIYDKEFDITQDPLYQMEGYDSDGPEDLSINLDKYLYGAEKPL